MSRQQKAKKWGGGTAKATPHLQSKVVSAEGATLVKRYIAPTLIPSEFCIIFGTHLNQNNMMYGNNGGLTVRGGRLINEKTDECMAPITQAAIMRKAMKREQKIEMIASGTFRGEMRSDAMENAMGECKDCK